MQSFKKIATNELDILPELLEDITVYRDLFLTKSETPSYSSDDLSPLSEEQVNEIKLIHSMFASAKTELCVPVLASFWRHSKNTNDHTVFYKACKKLCAFFILKRATVQGARGIDESLRAIMRGDPEISYKGLHLDKDSFEQPLDIDLFTIALKKRLLDDPIKVHVDRKNEWIGHVNSVNQYKNSKSILRFMLHAAHHNTGPSHDEKGLVTRTGYSNSTSRNFLTFESWSNELYSSIEHIAPASQPPGSHSYLNVYNDNLTRNLLGKSFFKNIKSFI